MRDANQAHAARRAGLFRVAITLMGVSFVLAAAHDALLTSAIGVAFAAPQVPRLPAELPGRISIVIEPGRAISPEEARAPAFLLDENGRILIVDQLQGFLVGRFAVPPGMSPTTDATGGVSLETPSFEGPPIPDAPLTTLIEARGFPFTTAEPAAGGLCVTDFERDGPIEIVIATAGGAIYRLDANGDVAPGWPRRIDAAFFAAPAIGDVDGDGASEIVIGDVEGRVHVWDDAGNEQAGWPVELRYEGFPTGSIFGAAALEDLNGDGSREICLGTSTGLVCVMDGDGHVWPGWPQVLPPATHPPNPAGIFASPAVTDIDGDRMPEIIVATNAGTVHAWEATGHAVNGWPIELPHAARAGYGGVAVGDVNGDDLPEIVVTTERAIDGPPTVTVLDAHGALLPGWPFPLAETCNGGAALGDLTGDGVAEIVVATIGGDALLYAFDGRSAEPVTGWPLRLRDRTVNTPPLLADLDGDGRVDILVAALSTSIDARAWLWAFNRVTDPLRGFPILIPDDEIVRATPAVTDLDNDGGLELLAATELRNTLRVWDLEAICEPELLPWPMLAGGPARTGALMAERFGRTTPPRLPDEAGIAPDGRASALSTIVFELDESAKVSLAIFDIKGRPVRTLLDYRLPPGSYDIRWDGRDDAGASRPAGIYFYQLGLNGRATTRQLLLLK
jgi:hypothetical protein